MSVVSGISARSSSSLTAFWTLSFLASLAVSFVFTSIHKPDTLAFGNFSYNVCLFSQFLQLPHCRISILPVNSIHVSDSHVESVVHVLYRHIARFLYLPENREWIPAFSFNHGSEPFR